MTREIKFSFPVDDVEMLTDCKKAFGSQLKIQREGALTGFDLVFVAIIPTIGVTISLVDFIVKHFIKDDKPLEEEERKSKRRIEYSNTRISLYNYEKEDAVQIIKELLGEKEDESNNS